MGHGSTTSGGGPGARDTRDGKIPAPPFGTEARVVQEVILIETRIQGHVEEIVTGIQSKVGENVQTGRVPGEFFGSLN
jgi:hypothetical protein